ncbi:hypothetical protein ACFL1I_08315 [Candidatus Omnitrophota bacterium]
MTPVDALKMAKLREQASIKLYRDLAIKHAELRDLLETLVIEEEKHKLLIEKKIVQLTAY